MLDYCLVPPAAHSEFLIFQVFRALGGGNGEKRRGGLHLARPKSPNMQELKRRFRQVLSSKVKSATTLWLQYNAETCSPHGKEDKSFLWKALKSSKLSQHRGAVWLFFNQKMKPLMTERGLCEDWSVFRPSNCLKTDRLRLSVVFWQWSSFSLQMKLLGYVTCPVPFSRKKAAQIKHGQ